MNAGMVLMRAMAEIQAKRIRPGQKQCPKLIRRRTGGADSRDDFGTALTMHGGWSFCLLGRLRSLMPRARVDPVTIDHPDGQKASLLMADHAGWA